MNENNFAGFWIRTCAAIIDSILVLLILAPILTAIYGTGYWKGAAGSVGGMENLLSYVFPAIAVIVFWMYKSATPGKMVFGLKIVDAETGEKPTNGQFIGRYFSYFVSTIPLFLGIIWVAFDKRKQGWHDKLAGTVVIRGESSANSTTEQS
jgi:uncharacterized RDD family membrane protein YckC